MTHPIIKNWPCRDIFAFWLKQVQLKGRLETMTQRCRPLFALTPSSGLLAFTVAIIAMELLLWNHRPDAVWVDNDVNRGGSFALIIAALAMADSCLIILLAAGFKLASERFKCAFKLRAGMTALAAAIAFLGISFVLLHILAWGTFFA